MRVLKIDDLPEKPMGSATPIAGWTGGTGEPDAAGDHRRRAVGELSLQRGEFQRRRDDRLARARLRSDPRGHRRQRHRRDETEEREITVGDVVHIKAGERHWHGAKADSTLSHITVTTVGSKSKH